jgi:glyoxylase-like metal-dependent hydrolase (beta-lactamase superfamily II)
MNTPGNVRRPAREAMVRELLPGVYQIETALGDRSLCLYLLRGERTILLDSGVRTTPARVIYPALAAAGLPGQIDLLVVSHADADHHGGNAGVRAGSPHATLLCHELDRPWIEAQARHLQGRYREVVAADDMEYPAEQLAWLADNIGADTPIDVGLRGGETLGLGDGVVYEVLHTPGHTAGHLALWQQERRLLLAQDAVLGRGVPDARGQAQGPPPYCDVDRYLDTIWRLQALRPDWLLTAHYPVLRGAAVAAFFATSLEFVGQLDAAVLKVVREARAPLPLSAIIAAVDARMGPFATPIQWAWPVLAHLDRHVAQGRLCVRADGNSRRWEAI